MAADLPVTPYGEVPSYEEKFTRTRTGRRRLSLSGAAPVLSETVVVRRPVVVAPPPVVVEEYPVYPAPPMSVAPRVYASPPVYAYAGPGGAADGAIDVTSAAVGKSQTWGTSCAMALSVAVATLKNECRHPAHRRMVWIFDLKPVG